MQRSIGKKSGESVDTHTTDYLIELWFYVPFVTK